MDITKGVWDKYIGTLRKVNEKAAEEMLKYMESKHWAEFTESFLLSSQERKELIDVAYGISTKYGEAASAAACEMYDAVAKAEKARVPYAVPAKTATYKETAIAVNGALKQSPQEAANAVGRLVKQAGVDTTVQNAIRDGAEWAWVPRGDTCAFCMLLASQGWVRASQKVLDGDHAEHIHNHCDCTFAIRFDGKSTVEGYDPDVLRAQYDAAEGNTWQDKLNSMRRAHYAANKDAINAQKRAAYARRHGLSVEKPKTKFKHADTIEEAQEYAKKYIEPQFMDKTFKGEADYKGISLEHANAINEALTEVYDAFPELDKLSGVKVISPTSARGKKAFKDGADALFAYNPVQRGIYINKAVLKDAKALEEYMTRSKESWDLVMKNIGKLSGPQRELAERYMRAGRSLVSGDTVKGLFTHELGHHVQWTMLDAKTTNALTSNMSKFAQKISGYAGASGSEYLAESFAAFMKGERKILDPDYVMYIEKRMKRGPVLARGVAPEPIMGFGPVLESNAVQVMRKEYATWVDSLTKEELHAIRKYTKNSLEETGKKFYEQLNAMLRGDIPEDKKLREYAETISRALKRKRLGNDMILHRNIGVDPFAGVPVGGQAPGRQFFSTSVVRSRALKGDYNLVILAPKGTPGAYLEEISRFPKQREFLIDKDCRYRVLSRKGKTIVIEVIV